MFHPCGELLSARFGDGGQDVGQAGEVAVDGLPGHAGLGRDVGEAGLGEAEAVNARRCRLDDPAARLVPGAGVVAIPDIALPAVRRLLESGAKGRERSGGRHYSRLVNGDRGGYLGYATWRKYLALAHGFTASHSDGMVTYTAHELRHVCASLLIASGASDVQVASQMGHSRVETTKNIYGHLFPQDRQEVLTAINAAVSRLSVQEGVEAEAA